MRKLVIALVFGFGLFSVSNATVATGTNGETAAFLLEDNGPHDIHPRIFNKLMQAASDYWNLSVGQCYQLMSSGDMTITPDVKDGLAVFDIEYDEGILCIFADNL